MAAAAPNRISIGGAGTSVPPELVEVEPPEELDELDDEELVEVDELPELEPPELVDDEPEELEDEEEDDEPPLDEPPEVLPSSPPPDELDDELEDDDEELDEDELEDELELLVTPPVDVETLPEEDETAPEDEVTLPEDEETFPDEDVTLPEVLDTLPELVEVVDVTPPVVVVEVIPPVDEVEVDVRPPVEELDVEVDVKPPVEVEVEPPVVVEVRPPLDVELEVEPPLVVEVMTTLPPLEPPPPKKPPKKPPPKPPIGPPPITTGTPPLPPEGIAGGAGGIYGGGSGTIAICGCSQQVRLMILRTRLVLRGCSFWTIRLTGFTGCAVLACLTLRYWTSFEGVSATWTAPPPMIAQPAAQADNFARAIRTDISVLSSFASGPAEARQERSLPSHLTQTTHGPVNAATPLTLFLASRSGKPAQLTGPGRNLCRNGTMPSAVCKRTRHKFTSFQASGAD